MALGSDVKGEKEPGYEDQEEQLSDRGSKSQLDLYGELKEEKCGQARDEGEEHVFW